MQELTTSQIVDQLSGPIEHVPALIKELRRRAKEADKLAQTHVYAIDIQSELAGMIVELVRQTYAKRGTPPACPAVTAAAIANAVEMLGDTYVPEIHIELPKVLAALASNPAVQADRDAAFQRFKEREGLAQRLSDEGRPSHEIQAAVFKLFELQNAKMGSQILT